MDNLVLDKRAVVTLPNNCCGNSCKKTKNKSYQQSDKRFHFYVLQYK